MHPAPVAVAAQHVGEQVGAPRLVVDAAHHGVLDGDPALGDPGVVPGRLDGLGDRGAGVDRDQRVAQLVVGGVQAQREGDRDALLGQLADARDQTDGRDGDAARRHAQAVGRGVGEAAYGADDGLVVGQRLAHAHEHHVVDAAPAAGHLVTVERAGPGDDLLDDLGGAHVALQAALAGGAERAGHAAAGLAGHAHRRAARVAHQHRLDEGAVEELPQRLARGALVGLHRLQRRHQVRQQRADQLGALPGGQVGHLLRVVDQAGEVVRRELLGPEARQPVVLEQLLALGRGEVGEVARRLLASARLLEDQRERGHALGGLGSARRDGGDGGHGGSGVLGHSTPSLPPARSPRRTHGTDLRSAAPRRARRDARRRRSRRRAAAGSPAPRPPAPGSARSRAPPGRRSSPADH